VYGPLGLILGFILLLDLNLWAIIVILHELSSQSPLSPSYTRVKFSFL
jgi:amino acid permease